MYAGHLPTNDPWLEQIFASRAATSGGVVRRARADVQRKIGLERLELEVHARGYHMLAAGDQIIVICSPNPIEVIV